MKETEKSELLESFSVYLCDNIIALLMNYGTCSDTMGIRNR